MISRTHFTGLVAAVAFILTACERPFTEPERPRIEIVSPDFSTIFPNTKLSLEVRAQAQRRVERIEVNGDTLTFDPGEQLWVADYALRPGLNRLVFAVTDADNQTSLDTAYAMHGEFAIDRNTPALPEPRGGHTATLANESTVYVLGGTNDATSDALASGFAWAQFQFRRVSGTMAAARTGHTASLLPDGRILILGGSGREPAEEIPDLVETVELFDPISETFRIVPTEGDPIRRAYHTASLHRRGNEIFVDVYGGLGDIQYRPTPRFGTRQDLRRFVFRNDSLLAVSPAPGPTLDFAIWGHTQTALEDVGLSDDQRSLVAGANYSAAAEQDVSMILDYGSQSGISQHETGALVHSRTRQASVLLQDGFVGTFGGYQESPAMPLGDAEIYSDEAGRFFAFPPSNVLLRRYGLTATKIPDGRILLVGGYFSAGQGAVTTSVVRIPFL